MCWDCQAFAHYLGRVDQMLDSSRGTEIIPVHPARVHFIQGSDKLACVRLSDDGLRRWYTTCCKTPVANTHPKNRLPFAGMHRSILDFSGDELLGPIYARINGKNSHGAFKATLATLRFLAIGIIQGLNVPWPFPHAQPQVGTDAEYYALIKKVKESKP